MKGSCAPHGCQAPPAARMPAREEDGSGSLAQPLPAAAADGAGAHLVEGIGGVVGPDVQHVHVVAGAVQLLKPCRTGQLVGAGKGWCLRVSACQCIVVSSINDHSAAAFYSSNGHGRYAPLAASATHAATKQGHQPWLPPCKQRTAHRQAHR